VYDAAENGRMSTKEVLEHWELLVVLADPFPECKHLGCSYFRLLISKKDAVISLNLLISLL
jgi:hypothetical protein